jgi:hypothetical protein
LDQATGSASQLLVSDRGVLRRMRHADEESAVSTSSREVTKSRKRPDGPPRGRS